MITITEQQAKKSVGKTSLFLTFDYNPEIIEIVKQTGDAFWHKDIKQWELPLSDLSFLINSLTFLDDISILLLESNKGTKFQHLINYRTQPMPHQMAGIQYLFSHHNAILADGTGLGKSIQVIYTCEELKAQKNIEHVLLICGISSLKANWKEEIKKHSSLDCIIIGEKINSKGTVSYATLNERAEQLYNPINEFFVIINIEMLTSNLVLDAIRDSKNKFDVIVVDEIHKAKNATSQRGKNLLKLAKVGDYHYALTATPLINNPLDAFVPLKFTNNEKATLTNFKQYYCVYEKKFGHNQITGFKNMDTLRDNLVNCMLRRKKDTIDLPPKMIIPEYLEMDQKQAKFYEDISNGVVEEADRVNIKTSSLLGLVTRLRQAATCPNVLASTQDESCKIERAVDLIKEICDNGDKVVVFSSFKEPLNNLYEKIKEYNPLLNTGDTGEIRDKEFQEDPKYKVFLGTTQKCGTGITLTAASYMIFLDAPWTYSDFLQSCDRIFRIGQTKSVTIYNLICKGTIDERINKILETKKGISEVIVDGDYNQNDDLKYLLGIGKY